MGAWSERFVTHEVGNQVPALEPFDAWASDQALQEAVRRHAAQCSSEGLAAYGRLVGGELSALGFEANRFRPQLKTFNRQGERIDEVEFHPAYHRLMSVAIQHGVHSHAWRMPHAGAQVQRAALSYLHHQAEAGTSCPLTMSFAAVPVLRQGGSDLADWLPRALALEYDGRNCPIQHKPGITLGMGMTEKQGGSDVRSNSTRAHSIGGDAYELVGHKWFCSAPMSDGFLLLAQANDGLSCFLLPRWRPDGSRNELRLMRLKDKLGNWANASSEIELHGALAYRIGAEGRGVATILDMVALTRLDCALGSAAEMRRALIEAVHHATHRQAFGRRLLEQPLMREVLADLALETEAATALAIRLAAAIDAAPRDAHEAAFARIATALGKFWICKRAPGVVNEAQECLGGAGYVEESILPRLYREAPLNSIWEGCGNIQCLDVLRALHREAGCRAALNSELELVRGQHPAYDAGLQRAERLLAESSAQQEVNGRRIGELLASLLQAQLLLRYAEPAIADAFCSARLAASGSCYGSALGNGAPVARLIERALVAG